MAGRGSLSFGEINQSPRGIFSFILGVISLVACLAFIIISFLKKGNAGIYIGIGAVAVFVISCIGIVNAIRGYREESQSAIFTLLGFIFNAIIIIAFIVLFVTGIM